MKNYEKQKAVTEFLMNYIVTAMTLFGGGGGTSCGLHKAGLKELLVVDFWELACKNLEANFSKHGVDVWNLDLLSASAEDLINRVGLKLRQLVTMWLSPPCQGLSLASGKLNPLDPRNALYLHSISLISGILPATFCIENTPGMFDNRLVGILNEIKRLLIEQLGDQYHIKCFKLRASNYNVPQIRDRSFVIGYRRDLGIVPTMPTPDYDCAKELRICDIFDHIDAVEVGQSKKNYKYKTRLLNTITATEGSFLVLSKGIKRKPTTEELKGFTTFPQEYIFLGDEEEVHKMIGNSVPPNFALAIARHIIYEIKDRLVELNLVQKKNSN